MTGDYMAALVLQQGNQYVKYFSGMNSDPSLSAYLHYDPQMDESKKGGGTKSVW